MNKMRMVSFLVSMVLLAISIAAGTYTFVSYREGGIFGSGFKTRSSLVSLVSNNEEIVAGLPSTTVSMEADLDVPSVNPSDTLNEAGRIINRAVKEEKSDVSSQVTNIHYVASNKDQSERVEFQFNASTPVDYSDDTFQKSVSLFTALRTMGFSKVTLVSSPTPDGERSYDVEVAVPMATPNSSRSLWLSAITPMLNVVNDSNLSSLTLNSGNSVKLTASFYDTESFQRARDIDVNIWDAVFALNDSKFTNQSVVSGEYIMSAVSPEDDVFKVTLSDGIETEEQFNTTSNTVIGFIRSGKDFATIASKAIVVVVEGNSSFRQMDYSKNIVW